MLFKICFKILRKSNPTLSCENISKLQAQHLLELCGITTKRKWMKWLVGTVQCMFHDVSNNQKHRKKVHKASWMFIGMSKIGRQICDSSWDTGLKSFLFGDHGGLGVSVASKTNDSTTQREKKTKSMNLPPKKSDWEFQLSQKNTWFSKVGMDSWLPFFWGAPSHCSLQWS